MVAMVQGIISKSISGQCRLRLRLYGIALAMIWLLLTGLDVSSLLIGIPMIGLALWYCRYLITSEGAPLSVRGMVRLGIYFIQQSFIGGWDLALRSCGKQVRIDPGMLWFARPFNPPQAHPLFIRCLNLLPGTLSVEERQGALLLHVIDKNVDHTTELERLGRLTEAVWSSRVVEDSA
ncbi:hypothetical protein DV711_00155 [Motiliproteus coralliicola]|uniref:Uncharacterized protein n=1 Tax=Motiliproteus coralliicola TaxID=2283196 RepID=A0A369WQV4_9GAMM|nr:Na+/H+ antiporter subunit E [Motiliproteus coralliicola]RDE24057.1 hypothetical protein DV711_00155 [Motiliproteus coralliicola]